MCLVGGIAFLTCGIGSAYAQDANISIGELPLADALGIIALKTGTAILFLPETVAGLKAHPFSGHMSAQEAVTAALAGTRLEMAVEGSRTLIVRPVAPSAPTPSRAIAAPAPTPSRDTIQASSSEIEQVVVSASRVTIAGYSQPTPVTVVGSVQLEANAYADIGDSLRDLPAVGQSASAGNGVNNSAISAGTSGTSTVNLRNLGIIRTLVLFDGQRVVQSNVTGGVDFATIPTSLIQRVDVVTGGASASWGSDAVAGVVNLILNKNFTGFKGNIEAGDNSADTYRQFKAEASWGTDFAGGRGHLILSGAYVNDPNTVYLGQAHWNESTFLLGNPAYAAGNGQTRLIQGYNCGQYNVTTGGVIVSNPAGRTGGPANSLAGIQFVGAGQTAPFNFGIVSGQMSCGGSANLYTSEQMVTEIADPLQSETLFAYGSYKITDSILASVQLNYGNSFSQNTGDAGRDGNQVITSDNAYLPASVAAVMAAGGITSFTMGTTDTNNVDPHDLSPSTNIQSLGANVNNNYRQLFRGVFTLTGTLGNDWGWNVYYQHGESRVALRVIADTNYNNFTLAADAVTVTAANRGTSGLPIGTIACRSTLTAPTNGCQPLDVFGDDVASESAINYINHLAPQYIGQHGGIDWENMTLNEDVASGSMQGTLPWQLPAGAVAVAFGAEYRKEGGRITTDPNEATAIWASGNFRNFAGQYEVAEGFLEVDAPLLKNNMVELLDFQGAGRMTSYSTSGLVETWKLGLNSQVTDDFKLRTTWSYDIRAPDLSELFTNGGITSSTETDPKTGKNVSTYSDTIGNPQLNPEASITISGGVVLTPSLIPGLSASFDWYSINIKNYIYTLSAANVDQQCINGVAAYCADLYYDGGSHPSFIPLYTPADYPGALVTVVAQPQNAASETTSGLDFQVDYTMDLFAGNLAWHLVGNYADETTITAPIIGKYDYVGSIGGDTLINGGVPKFKATLSATYTEGQWSGTIQTRMEGSAVLNNLWTSGVDVPNNNVPFNAYLDLRGSYRWNDNVQIYAAIDNTLDTPPPAVPAATVATPGGPASGNPFESTQTRLDLYDALGRSFRVGVRVTY